MKTCKNSLKMRRSCILKRKLRRCSTNKSESLLNDVYTEKNTQMHIIFEHSYILKALPRTEIFERDKRF